MARGHERHTGRAARAFRTAIVAGLLALEAAGQAGPARAAGACAPSAGGTTTTCTYAYTGGAQTFAVPAGVTAVTVDAVGGHGAATAGEQPKSLPS